MCIDNYNILSNTVLLVEEGLGVAVCLNGALAIHHSPQLRFVPLVPERSIRGVLIWKKNHVINPAISLFVQMVQRYGESERYEPCDGTKKETLESASFFHLVSWFKGRSSKGSPGANTRARSGFWMRAIKSAGSPLKGVMSGASTQPQCHSSRGVWG